jgi:ADP-ribose pyrophosphatase YjhB (NUDIX family)
MDLAAYLRTLAALAAERGKALIWPVRLGVRALVIDPQERVLLVRHTYVSGWSLPGGGVDAGESAEVALARELSEEAGVELLAQPIFHGLFFNPKASRRGHVACYVVRDFRIAPTQPNFEIAEARFFPADALPEDTSPPTCARLVEVSEGAPPSEIW